MYRFGVFFMKIEKIINNNVISAFDKNDREVVIMGKGIGFKAHPGDTVDRSKAEKIFRIENRTQAKQFQELLENMPLEHIQVSADIIAYARKNLNLKLSQTIYVTLTDHINFAIERYRQGIYLNNALLWEIKRFYHQEYLLGKYAVEQINKRLDMQFGEDEAGFIALHFVNAEYDTSIRDTFAMTKMIHEILDIVKEEFQIPFDEDSLHYERFVTHLKFLVQRLYRNEMLKDEDTEFAQLVQMKYPREYACARKISAYIEAEQGEKISAEEIMFLAIHIRRVCMKPDTDE